VSLTAKDVEEIVKLLEQSQFDRLSLEIDGMKIELERGGAKSASTSSARTGVLRNSVRPEPVEGPPPAKKQRQSAEEGLIEVKSPLLGIFYRAPKPGEPPFVEVGSKVSADTVIGIVEVMKLMNSARAGVAGEVIEILGENGELVEHGEVLMLVRPE
jgi:acetyl-CoA carboxylase biotin carboxyl carrier protein